MKEDLCMLYLKSFHFSLASLCSRYHSSPFHDYLTSKRSFISLDYDIKGMEKYDAIEGHVRGEVAQGERTPKKLPKFKNKTFFLLPIKYQHVADVVVKFYSCATCVKGVVAG